MTLNREWLTAERERMLLEEKKHRSIADQYVGAAMAYGQALKQLENEVQPCSPKDTLSK